MMLRAIFLPVLVFCVLVASCTNRGSGDSERTAIDWPAGLPVYDHIVIVVEENKDYDEIIGSANAPYINDVLKVEGANFTRAFGEEHFSQGNYFWFFSGDSQTIGFFDQPPEAQSLHTPNLGQQLIGRGLSFKGFSESLPAIGSTVDLHPEGSDALFARKHVPWISFANVPNGTTVETSSNLRFEDFPSDSSEYATLPTVAFVIPNLENDMHNGAPEQSIPAGDRWLRENLDAYYQWAKENNSLLILTFDENNDRRGFTGLTNPFVDPSDPTHCVDEELCSDLQNRIVTIFAGAHIEPGDYDEENGITHVNILRTLEAMYGLDRAGAQQPNAARNGIADDYIITDVFERAPQSTGR